MDGYAPLDELSPHDDLNLLPMCLPPLPPRFLVPPLTDKPQNPIMDTVKQEIEAHKRQPFHYLPKELSLLAVERSFPPPLTHSNLWSDALTRNMGIRNKALSWDRLRPSHPNQASSTGFLSEQDSLVFAAARYHVNLRLRDPTVNMVYVTQKNLLNALKMTVLGTSSVYHTWDASSERFTQAGLEDNQKGFLLLDGKDEVISQSLLSRFLTIGNLLRRLEVLVETLRARSANEGPIVHAYAHALSTIVTFLRQDLARCPPVNDPLSTQHHTLSAIWMHYEIYEDILVSLADLCGREETTSPENYPPLQLSPVILVSTIYSHLERHIERQSPRTIRAILAYVLTHVSYEYLQQVSRSVGYGTDSLKKASRDTGQSLRQDQSDEEDEEDEEEDSDLHEPLDDTFPDFFPPALLDILSAARKSLVLLEKAQPDHPILQGVMTQGVIQWFWTESAIESAWEGQYPNTQGDSDATPSSVASLIASTVKGEEHPEFSIFKLFDQEPGAIADPSAAVAEAEATTHSLRTFIDEFPVALPPITPTLSHLASLVFAPLVQHASTLSSGLLTLFLTPSTTKQDTLNFETHLSLLRSYLLVAAPPFKSRLAAALFSDKDCDIEQTPHGMSIRSLRRPSSKKKGPGQGEGQPWAVGLAPSLLERETWPPVGADLSFFLRTVIVDSFENVGRDADEAKISGSRVLEEAEYRLGFAIRDLPTGPAKDTWLNPLSIEALDFLYIDYKVPSALEVLITHDILSKYQRMFAFILRLMRVEHALGSLFRMTRSPNNPLFPTLAPSRKHLLHFRFVAQSFVSNLSAYVFDTAIAGNFDPFLARLSPPKDGHEAAFSDVFALAKDHSRLLDDMLSACLLRSGQRAVGELLRSALELILEFTVVVGELYRARMEEYQAAPMLEDISKKYFEKMAKLMKVLMGLADKNGSLATAMPLQGSLTSVEMIRKPTGGADALYHLLIRLDLGEWWTTRHDRRRT